MIFGTKHSLSSWYLCFNYLVNLSQFSLYREYPLGQKVVNTELRTLRSSREYVTEAFIAMVIIWVWKRDNKFIIKFKNVV